MYVGGQHTPAMRCRAAWQAVSASWRALSAAVRVEVNCSREGPLLASWRCLDLTLAAIALTRPCTPPSQGGDGVQGERGRFPDLNPDLT